MRPRMEPRSRDVPMRDSSTDTRMTRWSLQDPREIATPAPAAVRSVKSAIQLKHGASRGSEAGDGNLYVVGGRQRSERPLHAGAQSWYRYGKGVVLRVDPVKQRVDSVFEYVSPAHVCAPQDPAVLFKSGTRIGDLLYLCTQTEILVYRLPEFSRLHYISLPQFNDVHHVRPTPHGTLLVANTGLDLVLEITLTGEVVREWSTYEGDPWSRFSRSRDYRTVASTKPYVAHPNYIFYVDSDVWVTRFEQRDAICLTSPGKRITIGLERVHDGIVSDDWIYFSTVNGKIAIVSRSTLRVEEVWDLGSAAPLDLLGWCRGLLLDGGRLWVGFSRLRPTKFRENVSWVASGFKRVLPTRVACYDLSTRACVSTVNLEEYGLNAVFSVHPADTTEDTPPEA